MSHRSGLVREPPAGHYFDPAPPSLDGVVHSLAKTTLVFEPGTRTKYSNAGVTVVGAIVEKIAKEPFAGAVDRALFRPLAMTRTSFQPGPAIAAEMAEGSMWTYDGQTGEDSDFLFGHRAGGQPRFVRDRPRPVPEFSFCRRPRRPGELDQARDTQSHDRAAARQAR